MIHRATFRAMLPSTGNQMRDRTHVRPYCVSL